MLGSIYSGKVKSIMNMKNWGLIIIFLKFSFLSHGQIKNKPLIDTSTFEKWISVESPLITNNGKYVSYFIKGQPMKGGTQVFQGISNGWKFPMVNVRFVSFTANSKMAIFLNKGDSLCFLKLGGGVFEYIPNILSFKLYTIGVHEWIAYQTKAKEKKLIFRNLETGQQRSFENVNEYLLNLVSSVVVLKIEREENGLYKQSIVWDSFLSERAKLIWEGQNASNLVLDANGLQLAFTVLEEGKNPQVKSFWYYKVGTQAAELLTGYNPKEIREGLRIDKILRFSLDGSRIFFTLKDVIENKDKQKNSDVSIWNYSDTKLLSQQIYELTPNVYGTGGEKSYFSVMEIKSHRIIQLQNNDEEIRFLNAKSDKVALLINKVGHSPLFSLISTYSGERTDSPIKCPYVMSPGGKFLIGTDSTTPFMNNGFSYLNNNIYSYDFSTMTICNITQSLPVPDNENNLYGWACLRDKGLKIAGWLANDEAVLVYDKYDIWQVDLTGRKRAINLTKGYGRKHNIVFRIPFRNEIDRKAINNGDRIILSAFDRSNKNNGFYCIILGNEVDPELLSMDKCLSDAYPSNEFSHIFVPLKAKNAEVYIVERQTITTSPNYYFTYNFKKFASISEVYPEKEYNWLTDELIAFKTLDGKDIHGILYKPENFDSTKKYPVILYYYRTLSDRLNEYLPPQSSDGRLWPSIPFFVSNGYLVFTPDIYYKVGETGESAINSVLSAAEYLATMPYIDSKKMGIQGHSFGGFETNYLITHTKIFAAACSASGLFDFVSGYGSIVEGQSKQWQFEFGPYQIGATLWQRPDLYIKNSPIFSADKVSTPFLMMATTKDATIPFAQPVAFFTALRKLGKKAWLLQYDDGDHTLEGMSAVDFTIRMKQFFDYYLKGVPPPKWMKEDMSYSR